MRLVGVCDTQAITGEGLRTVLAARPDLRCVWTCQSVFLVRQLLASEPVDLVLLDKGFGFQTVLNLLSWVRQQAKGPECLVWGTNLTESEALQLLREGVKGVLRKTCSADALVHCLSGVLAGRTWVDDFGATHRTNLGEPHHSELTQRERQVLELVEQGMRNKQIATELGIKHGTVKIHMKHIFEKTGIHGRYGLAIQSMRRRSYGVDEAPVAALAERAG